MDDRCFDEILDIGGQVSNYGETDAAALLGVGTIGGSRTLELRMPSPRQIVERKERERRGQVGGQMGKEAELIVS